MTDPKVILKKEYLDAKGSSNRRAAQAAGKAAVPSLSGKDWYNQ